MSQTVIAPIPENLVRTTLRVNNTIQELSHDPRLTLLDALRDTLGLTGTKNGCDQGACVVCTVIIDGQRALSCLTLAAACEEQHVVTIEGLVTDNELHPMQSAFLEDAISRAFLGRSQGFRSRVADPARHEPVLRHPSSPRSKRWLLSDLHPWRRECSQVPARMRL